MSLHGRQRGGYTQGEANPQRVPEANTATAGAEGSEGAGNSSDETIRKMGDFIKNHPLRQEYENAVKALGQYEVQLRAQGLREKNIAELMYQARRDLGVKYKDLTPASLREYIYAIN